MRAASRSTAFRRSAISSITRRRRRAGIALTMFGGSSNVAPDSPNIFRQLNVGVDEIIPHFQQFSERIHAHGRGPDVPDHASGPSRRALCLELAADHRALADPRDAASQLSEGDGRARHRPRREGVWRGGAALPRGRARRHRGAGGGHLDRPVPVAEDQPAHRSRSAARWRTAAASASWCSRRSGARSATISSSASATWSTRAMTAASSFEECVAIARMFERAGQRRFLQRHLRAHGHRGGARDRQHARHGLADRALARAGRRIQARGGLPVFHAARISDIATARHAIREGLLDMVAMTRAHIADPYIVAKIAGRPRGPHPPLRRRDPLPIAIPAVLPAQSVDRARKTICRHDRRAAAPGAEGRRGRRRTGRARGGARLRRAGPSRRAVRGGRPARRAGSDRRARQLAQGPRRHRRLAATRSSSGSASRSASTPSRGRPTCWPRSPIS